MMHGADGGSGCDGELSTLQVSGHLLLILQSDFMWSELMLTPVFGSSPPQHFSLGALERQHTEVTFLGQESEFQKP